MGNGWQWVVGVVAAIAVPVFAYLQVVRRASGRIQTTEAAKLWDEAEKLRVEYKDEIVALRKRTDELRRRNDELTDDNKRLRDELDRLLQRVTVIEENGG